MTGSSFTIRLLQNLAHDLRSTLLPSYPALLFTVLSILPTRNPTTQAGPSVQTSSAHPAPRKLSPQTLTSILQTLSSLFRYILIPTTGSNLLPLIKPSWQLLVNAMCGLLRRKGLGASGEEIERMLAECWGSFIRRIKKDDARSMAVSLLVEDLERCEGGVAWSFISALQVRIITHLAPGPNLVISRARPILSTLPPLPFFPSFLDNIFPLHQNGRRALSSSFDEFSRHAQITQQVRSSLSRFVRRC